MQQKRESKTSQHHPNSHYAAEQFNKIKSLISTLAGSPQNGQIQEEPSHRDSKDKPYTFQKLNTLIKKFSQDQASLLCTQAQQRCENTNDQKSSTLSRNTQLDKYSNKEQKLKRQISITQFRSQDVYKYIAPLFRGIILCKYCFNTFKIEAVILTISEDLLYMSLYGLINKEMKVYSLKDWLGTKMGFQTPRFKQYVDRKYKIQEDQCFSLQFKERTFDFCSVNRNQRKRSMKHFTVLYSLTHP